MKIRSVLAMAALAVAPMSVHAEGSSTPEAGDAAPAFELVGSDGESYSLAEFAGKQAVVIAWFPKAFTGG